MIARLVVALVAAGFASSTVAQSIAPDRKVVPGYVYSYEHDGVRHYSSKPLTSGAYRAIPYSVISTTGSWRINGLPCEAMCFEEAQGYRKAKAAQISDIKDCPKEPELEARGCNLWLIEQRDKGSVK